MLKETSILVKIQSNTRTKKNRTELNLEWKTSVYS